MGRVLTGVLTPRGESSAGGSPRSPSTRRGNAFAMQLELVAQRGTTAAGDSRRTPPLLSDDRAEKHYGHIQHRQHGDSADRPLILDIVEARQLDGIVGDEV